MSEESAENRDSRGKYSCPICELNFRRKDRLDRHLFIHTGIKTFICDYENCKKEFTNSSHLKRHLNNCHLNKPKINSYICEFSNCLQGFTNFSNLNRHYKKNHLNVVEYKCDQCMSISFRRKDQLRRHMKNNHNIGSFAYTCQKCGNGYFNKFTYLKHIKVHDVKECKDCHMHFEKWSQLVVHRKEEHKFIKNNRLECDICGKIFCRKPNIREHMKIHSSKECVYSCPYENCSKFYTAKRNLTAHIRSKHEGKKFLCKICKVNLSSNHRLEKHLASHELSIPTTLKKSNIALLLGVKLHSSIQSELFKNVPVKNIIDGISTESEFSE